MGSMSVNSVMSDLMDTVRDKTGKTNAMSIREATSALKAIEEPIMVMTVTFSGSTGSSGVYILDRDTNEWNEDLVDSH